MPCAFCGQLERIEDAHIKDEHVLKDEGMNVRSARQGNIIPLCREHHREYFDCPRRAERMDEKKEFQFEPRLIIDLVNTQLIMYDNREDDSTIDGLYRAITIVPMYQHAQYFAKREYVIWKNKRMHERLLFYLYKENLLRELTQL